MPDCAECPFVSAAELLIAWDKYGGDAPEILMDAVREAREATKDRDPGRAMPSTKGCSE